MNPNQKKILYKISNIKFYFQRILRPRTLHWEIESGHYRVPASELPKLWEEFYPKSANRSLTITWWNSFFLKDTMIRFNESVGGRSTIQYGKTWQSSNGISSIFFWLGQSYMKEEESRWESILQEFSEYCNDSKKWDRFLRFPLFQNSFLPATSISFDWGVLVETKISYELAESFYLRRAVPSSLEKGSVKLKIFHLNLIGVKYPLYQEDFVLNGRNYWLRDFFLEVRTKENAQTSKPTFHYIGSQYSLSEVEKHCIGIKLLRKILLFDVEFSFVNPLLIVRLLEKNYQINDWKECSIPEQYGSRFEITSKKTYFNSDCDGDITKISLLPKGNYLLDKNLLDLPLSI